METDSGIYDFFFGRGTFTSISIWLWRERCQMLWVLLNIIFSSSSSPGRLYHYWICIASYRNAKLCLFCRVQFTCVFLISSSSVFVSSSKDDPFLRGVALHVALPFASSSQTLQTIKEYRPITNKYRCIFGLAHRIKPRKKDHHTYCDATR